jgi:hypothetical protein
MRVTVLLVRTAKRCACEIAEAQRARIKIRILSREDDQWREAARGERRGDGLQFDGFRPGPDDQPNVRKIQLSP